VTKSIRLLLADDHTLVRAGMRTLLGTLPDVEVVAEASDGREALRLVEQHRPDVVLMDVTMPELNGLEATARVAKDFPETRVVMLSMHASEEYVLQALNAGAAGYLLKESDIAELELAIKAVARGESYLSPAVSKHVIANYVRRTGGDNNTANNVPDLLTPRQRDVLRLIADGRSTKEIARILNVSVKTVETHRMQLMERLGIHDVAGLVRYALRVGLTKAE
jgi:DNA-binding NarL/FixJ family response regulator